MEAMSPSSDVRGWVYSIVAGLACIFGATVVFWDVLLAKIPYFEGQADIRDSAQFQVASMGLGAGVLLFSALRNLVPESENYFDSPLIPHSVQKAGGLVTIAGFFFGAGLCMGLSELVHHYTPESIVHCGEHEHSVEHDKSQNGDELEENGSRDQTVSGESEDGCMNSEVQDSRLESIQSRKRPSGPTLKRDMYDCSLGHNRNGTLNMTSSPLRPRVGIRHASHSDRTSKQAKHYHIRCAQSGVCAGYTAPCFSASCVCDGHQVSRTPSPLWSLGRHNLPRQQSGKSLRSDLTDDLESGSDVEAHERSALLSRSSRPEESADDTLADDTTDPGANKSIDDRQDGQSSVHHHHHHDDDSSKMLRIGIQTSLAICLHKFPEGFITFISAHADQQLGLTLFLAIALHNISEGAVIAYPLLVATGSRSKAFFSAALLGGLSGPMGALVGFLLTRSGLLHRDDPTTPIVYGILFAVVAGFMSTISIQSMLPAAIKEDRTNGKATTIWFSVGVGIIALAGALTKG